MLWFAEPRGRRTTIIIMAIPPTLPLLRVCFSQLELNSHVIGIDFVFSAFDCVDLGSICVSGLAIAVTYILVFAWEVDFLLCLV